MPAAKLTRSAADRALSGVRQLDERMNVCEQELITQIRDLQTILSEHHAILQAQREQHIRILYLMQKIVVTRHPDPRAVVTSPLELKPRTATLYEFFIDDREGFLAQLEAMEQTIAERAAQAAKQNANSVPADADACSAVESGNAVSERTQDGGRVLDFASKAI